jgi:hypothetical protein
MLADLCADAAAASDSTKAGITSVIDHRGILFTTPP